MGDGGRRFWFEGVELGRAKVESVEDVVARITGGAVDRLRGKRRRVRMITRIRVGGGMTTAQQRTTRMWMVRIMDWDQLIEYLGDVWEEI